MSKRRLDPSSPEEPHPTARHGLGYGTSMSAFPHTASAPELAPSSSSPSSPAYRPTSPVYAPIGCVHQEQPDSFTFPSMFQRHSMHHPGPGYIPVGQQSSIYQRHPDYRHLLQRIERSDPSFKHVSLMFIVNRLFGHPEYEYSHEPVFSDEEAIALGHALSKNMSITSLDLGRLALGSQAVTIMSSLTHLTTLTSLDFRDNFISHGDAALVFHHAAAAGMTQLQQLLICEPGHCTGALSVMSITRSTYSASPAVFL
jgi:hypothetical protein